jgi:DnaJ-class molecular chaperone
MNTPKNVCNTCGGSGEIGYFQGESRFFITREECPACCGLGYTLEDTENQEAVQPGQEDGINEKGQ